MNEGDKDLDNKLSREVTNEVYEAFERIAERRGMSVEQLFQAVVKETLWRLKASDAIQTIEGGKEGPTRPKGPAGQPSKPQPK